MTQHKVASKQYEIAIGERNSIPLCHDPNCYYNIVKANKDAELNAKMSNKKNEVPFTSPTRRKSAKVRQHDNSKVNPISLNNKFNSLGNDVDLNDENTDEIAPAKETFPPIMVKYTKEYGKMLADTTRVCGHTENKFGNGIIKMYASSKEQYDSLTKFLKQQGYEYYLIKPRDKRPLKVVIKNLPPDQDTTDIETEFKAKNFSVIKATRLTQFRTRKPLPFFLLELNRTPKVEEVYSVKSFKNLQIEVEPFRGRQQIVQCFACNSFNHVAEQCQMRARCLKCGQNHQTNACSIKERVEMPTCINCGKVGHVAAYRGCENFPKIKPPPTRRNTFNSNQYSTRSNLSFARVVDPNKQPDFNSSFPPLQTAQNNTTNITNSISFPELGSKSEISELFEALNELKKLMSECPSLIQALLQMKNAKTPEDKLQILMIAFSPVQPRST
ncbi:Nucleic-acid-binding protein from transposon X-element [Araneus ventricosus]|uniref:Nucleic-acid-binding protein from transposon X-element n=1 Tax=Araneus ventricosus TaxID=182803 RepID=A0A4Y2WKT9_ARAVE|nr:Nucleic-acid-binding protein from transposon X-element [Araneus ventricosus]